MEVITDVKLKGRFKSLDEKMLLDIHTEIDIFLKLRCLNIPHSRYVLEERLQLHLRRLNGKYGLEFHFSEHEPIIEVGLYLSLYLITQLKCRQIKDKVNICQKMKMSHVGV